MNLCCKETYQKCLEDVIQLIEERPFESADHIIAVLETAIDVLGIQEEKK